MAAQRRGTKPPRRRAGGTVTRPALNETPTTGGARKKGHKTVAQKAQSMLSGRGDAARAVFVQKGNDRYDRHDPFYRQAKADGYLARSVYKLEELDEQFQIIRKGDVVLDLGCAPGSWMQYAERRVSEAGGRLVGIDILPAKVSFGPHVHIIVGDIYDTSLDELRPPPREDEKAMVLANDRLVSSEPRPFDVVLSDMAPNTTGIRSVDQARSAGLCEHALDIAAKVLRPGGRFCMKVFEGADTKELLMACRKVFKRVKVKRPIGVRVGSKETYVVGIDRRPIDGEAFVDDDLS
ncbi:MAG: RlmE family RNA methyltransferase [Deltaproteobacteria bacterium]|nr:RlmE family RNA methyltransferase [Deltaproteobacteria bacterium]